MKLILCNEQGHLRVIPDSAIGRSGQPWFLPEEGGTWCSRFAKAMRIGRLGKAISPKFAARYVDAATLLWVPGCSDAFPACDFMDGAVVCGKWVEADLGLDDADCRLIAEASRFATLKTGDIIARILDGSPEPIVADSHVSAMMGESEVLSFNVK